MFVFSYWMHIYALLNFAIQTSIKQQILIHKALCGKDTHRDKLGNRKCLFVDLLEVVVEVYFTKTIL